jgi:inner membrane protein
LAGAIILGVPVTGVAQVDAVAAGSLLPDIDLPGSTISRVAVPVFGAGRVSLLLLGIALAVAGYIFLPMRPLAWLGIFCLTVSLLPHRGVTHSLFGAAVALFAVHSFAADLLYAFAVGYLWHLAADILSGGAPLLWPFPFRVSLLGRGPGSILDPVCLLFAWAVVAARVAGLIPSGPL